ncbi:GNAT family N-acetyltransferase [Kitasatospora sp. NPDC088134]|uniref:GNAT family N-acetyltransferase n=1 Tax=Kitasatospora sp. NPDC088134 TaxID=3364071 RepID=UPI0038148683
MSEPRATAVLRPREAGDLPRCAAVLRAVHKADGYPRNWPADPAAWLATAGQCAALVAVLDGEIVGHAALTPGTARDTAAARWAARTGRDAAETAEVGRLFVAPTARGLGLGARLLAAAGAAAHERGLHPVLCVRDGDRAAVALYRRAGWTDTGTAREDWPDGPVTLRCFAGPARADEPA